MADHYDIIIIGLGCAGSHLVQAILRGELDRTKKIMVIEQEETSVEKTWCFWEQGDGIWDQLIAHQWSEGVFFGKSVRIDLEMGSYRYKMMESEMFIAFAKANIRKSTKIDLVYQGVTQIADRAESIEVHTKAGRTYTSDYLFDSRPPQQVSLPKYSLVQHFKGWFVKTDQPVLDPDKFTMMDYRLTDGATTSFMYCLPFSKTRGLVEFTYFTPENEPSDRYGEFNERYLKEFLEVGDFQIEKTEAGVLPMTTYDFQQHDTERHIHIGTAGGWLKPSSGYSFKFAERYSDEMVRRLESGQPIAGYLTRGRFDKYDKTILRALAENNSQGPALFSKMYGLNPASRIFSFLDEDTSFSDELKIMYSMTTPLIIKSFMRSFLAGNKK